MTTSIQSTLSAEVLAGAVAVILVVVVSFLAVTILLFLLIWRKKKNQKLKATWSDPDVLNPNYDPSKFKYNICSYCGFYPFLKSSHILIQNFLERINVLFYNYLLSS